MDAQQTIPQHFDPKRSLTLVIPIRSAAKGGISFSWTHEVKNTDGCPILSRTLR
jgi:hypothetical protein